MLTMYFLKDEFELDSSQNLLTGYTSMLKWLLLCGSSETVGLYVTVFGRQELKKEIRYVLFIFIHLGTVFTEVLENINLSSS